MAGKFNFQWPFSCVSFTEIEVHKGETIEQFGSSAAINQQNWMIFTRESRRHKVRSISETGIYAI